MKIKSLNGILNYSPTEGIAMILVVGLNESDDHVVCFFLCDTIVERETKLLPHMSQV